MQKLFDKILEAAEIEISNSANLDSEKLPEQIYNRHKIKSLTIDINKRDIREVPEFLNESNMPLGVPVSLGAQYNFLTTIIPFDGDMELLNYVFSKSSWTREVFVSGPNLAVKLCIHKNGEPFLEEIKQKARGVITNIKNTLQAFNLKTSEFNETTLREFIAKKIEAEVKRRQDNVTRLKKLDPFG